jgi:septal ring factor EnvC (AmiA/AmiB activator)
MSEQPAGKWQLNLQTIATLAGIGGVLIAWGYTLSAIQRDTDRNSASVAQLTIGLEQNDSKTDQLEQRMQALEKIASDAITLRRQLEGTLGEFRSDIAVMKEILMRIEKKEKQP